MTQIAQRIGFVIKGRIALDTIAVGGPSTQINQAAALGAERALRALGAPDNGCAAGGALDDAGLGGIAHRLQKVILKNNINYCFFSYFLRVFSAATHPATHICRAPADTFCCGASSRERCALESFVLIID